MEILFLLISFYPTDFPIESLIINMGELNLSIQSLFNYNKDWLAEIVIVKIKIEGIHKVFCELLGSDFFNYGSSLFL